MALCLQQHRIGAAEWSEWWGDLPVFDDSAPEIVEYLVGEGYFETDAPFLHIGPEAERRFGRRYFSDLTAVFTASPEFLVLAGRVEVGTIGTDLLTESVDGPRILLLGGRSWKMTHVDWDRRHCFVEAAHGGGKAKWSGTGGGLSLRHHPWDARNTARRHARGGDVHFPRDGGVGRPQIQFRRQRRRRRPHRSAADGLGRPVVDLGRHCSEPDPPSVLAVGGRLPATHRREVGAAPAGGLGGGVLGGPRRPAMGRSSGGCEYASGAEVFVGIASDLATQTLSARRADVPHARQVSAQGMSITDQGVEMTRCGPDPTGASGILAEKA